MFSLPSPVTYLWVPTAYSRSDSATTLGSDFHPPASLSNEDTSTTANTQNDTPLHASVGAQIAAAEIGGGDIDDILATSPQVCAPAQHKTRCANPIPRTTSLSSQTRSESYPRNGFILPLPPNNAARVTSDVGGNIRVREVVE